MVTSLSRVCVLLTLCHLLIIMTLCQVRKLSKLG